MNPNWRRYLAFWGARVEEDVDEELTFHIDMLVRSYIARGFAEPDARRAAERRLGNIRRTRSTCLTIGHRRQRRMARAQTIDALQQDVRYALRTLGRAKSWTTVALLTLGLGIGASTAMFSVLNSLVLNPIKYPGADRIATLWRVAPGGGVMMTPRRAMTDAWEKSARSLEAFEPYGKHPVTLSNRETSTELIAGLIRPTFPAFAGTPLVAGRSFAPDEMVAGGPHVVIAGAAIARDRFGSPRDALGKTLLLDDAPYTVIGVAAPAMRLPVIGERPPHVWLPMRPDTSGLSSSTVVRVRAGTTFEAAAAEMDSIVVRSGLQEHSSSKAYTTRLAPPAEFVSFRTSVYLLSGAVALLLVVACANVAHLSLARGASRSRELAIRAAIGAGRGRLLRQLLTESLLLAAIGGALGIIVAMIALKLLVAASPSQLSELSTVAIDRTSLWTSLALSALTGLAFGLAAAIDSVRRTTPESLRTTALSGGDVNRTHRLRSVLVVTEMALSAMLLVTAILLVRSVLHLRAVDPGFQVADLFSVEFALPERRYNASAKRTFLDDFMTRARGLPGVKSVTAIHSLPPDAGIMVADIGAEGAPDLVSRGMIAESPVQGTFFSTVGIPMVEGRTFEQGAAERDEVIINRGFARAVWPGQSVVGKHLRIVTGKPNEKQMTIVGVVGDVPRFNLRGDRTQPILYAPISERDDYPPSRVAIRVTPGTDPTDGLRLIAKSIDPRLIPPTISTAAAGLAETIAQDTFTMLLLGVFAGLAVVLSAVGLYGVISYVVAQRTREIGIRIALGATSRDVATSVIGRGVALSAFGVAIGLVAAIWGTKLVRAALFGVTGADPLSFVATAVVLLAVSALACLRPTARALSIDPAIAMRGD